LFSTQKNIGVCEKLRQELVPKKVNLPDESPPDPDMGILRSKLCISTLNCSIMSSDVSF